MLLLVFISDDKERTRKSESRQEEVITAEGDSVTLEESELLIRSSQSSTVRKQTELQHSAKQLQLHQLVCNTSQPDLRADLAQQLQ